MLTVVMTAPFDYPITLAVTQIIYGEVFMNGAGGSDIFGDRQRILLAIGEKSIWL